MNPLLFALFVGPASLVSPVGAGVAMETGARVELHRNFALGFDFGYGVMSAAPFMQDRWWLMPSAALVLPFGRLKVDVGLGLGLGTSTAFESLATYSKDHPQWDMQAVPSVRAHVAATLGLTERFSLYARAEAATMIQLGNVGFRSGNPDPTFGEGSWASAGAGVQIGL